MKTTTLKKITDLTKKRKPKLNYQRHLVVLCEQLEDAITAQETESANAFFHAIVAAVRKQQEK